MKIMDKYLLRCYLGPLVYCLLTFCMIFVIFDLFDHLSKFMTAQTPPSLIALYYGLLLAITLEYLVPASLLLAILYTLWQLTRNNELTAMRASGVSLRRIMIPFLAVGLAFTLFSAVLKEFVGPHASEWTEDFTRNKYRPVEARVHRNLAYYNGQGRRQWLIGSFSPDSPKVLDGVSLTLEREDGTREKEFVARRAVWMDRQWWFHDVTVKTFDADDNPILLSGAFGQASNAVMEMSFLTETPGSFANTIKNWDFLSTLEMVLFLKDHPSLSAEVVWRKEFDIHRRIAMPWACLIVTLFGIPAGARGGRQSALTGVLKAIAFFFAFYALTQLGVFLGKRQIVWPWLGAWLSNAVFFAAGVYMLLRIK